MVEAMQKSTLILACAAHLNLVFDAWAAGATSTQFVLHQYIIPHFALTIYAHLLMERSVT